jgi:hypothetical protein
VRKTEPRVEVPVKQTADGCRIVLDGSTYKTRYYVMEFETTVFTKASTAG